MSLGDMKDLRELAGVIRRTFTPTDLTLDMHISHPKTVETNMDFLWTVTMIHREI